MRKLPSSLTISDPAAASAFSNAKARAVLFALMRRPSSLKNLHDELGLSFSLLHYHVAKLRRCGLVIVERSEARAGRAVAIYTTTASSFKVPTHLTQLSGSGELMTELNQALEQNLSRCPPDAVVYELNEDRAPRMRRVSNADAPFMGGEWWFRLTLSDRQAADLTAEMRKLITRYGNPSDPHGGWPYLLHLAVAQT